MVRKRRYRKGDAEKERVGRRHHRGDGGALRGPFHAPVDVAVVNHIEDARRARGHVAAQNQAEQRQQAGKAFGRDKHRAHRSEEQKTNDFRLGQRDVVAQRGADRSVGGGCCF